MTKTFDWALFSARHSPEWAAWLEANHASPVTEAEYAEAYRAQRGADTRPHKARRYATAKLRANYRNLLEDFGFFVSPPQNSSAIASMDLGASPIPSDREDMSTTASAG